MKSAVLSNWNMPWLSSFALIIFFSIFMVMIYMITRKGSTEFYGEASQLPLKDEGVRDE
jgi:cbb3-type cytochrome oxidase subunit 3